MKGHTTQPVPRFASLKLRFRRNEGLLKAARFFSFKSGNPAVLFSHIVSILQIAYATVKPRNIVPGPHASMAH